MKATATLLFACLCAAANAQTCFNPVPPEFVDFTQSHLGPYPIVTAAMFDQTDLEHVYMSMALETDDCLDIVVCESQADGGSPYVPLAYSGDRCVSAHHGFGPHEMFPGGDTWWMQVYFTEGITLLSVRAQTLSDLPLYEDTTCGTVACDNPSFLVQCYNVFETILIDQAGSDFMPQHATTPGVMTLDDSLNVLLFDDSGLERIRRCDIWGDRAELVLGMIRVHVFRHIHPEEMPPSDNDPLFCNTHDGWPCGWIPDAGAQ